VRGGGGGGRGGESGGGDELLSGAVQLVEEVVELGRREFWGGPPEWRTAAFAVLLHSGDPSGDRRAEIGARRRRYVRMRTKN